MERQTPPLPRLPPRRLARQPARAARAGSRPIERRLIVIRLIRGRSKSRRENTRETNIPERLRAPPSRDANPWLENISQNQNPGRLRAPPSQEARKHKAPQNPGAPTSPANVGYQNPVAKTRGAPLGRIYFAVTKVSSEMQLGDILRCRGWRDGGIIFQCVKIQRDN